MQRYGKTLKRSRIFPIFSNFAVKINKGYEILRSKFQHRREAGFETFEDTDEGVKGYVQQTLFNEDLLKTLMDDFPLPSCSVSFTTQEAEDKDWNEHWEQQGFEPIVVNDTLVIHDGRHLPSDIHPQTSDIHRD